MNKSGSRRTRADLARMLGGVANVASAVRNQARSDIQARVEGIISRMDLVKRNEFEELETMLQQARTQQEELETRVAKLEAEAASSARAKSGKDAGTKSTSASKGKSGTQRKTSNAARKTGSNKKSS